MALAGVVGYGREALRVDLQAGRLQQIIMQMDAFLNNLKVENFRTKLTSSDEASKPSRKRSELSPVPAGKGMLADVVGC
jgi:hypothetical protein